MAMDAPLGSEIAPQPLQPRRSSHWQVALDADLTSKLKSGSNRLEVAVVSKLVSSPSFASFDFVTAQ